MELRSQENLTITTAVKASTFYFAGRCSTDEDIFCIWLWNCEGIVPNERIGLWILAHDFKLLFLTEIVTKYFCKNCHFFSCFIVKTVKLTQVDMMTQDLLRWESWWGSVVVTPVKSQSSSLSSNIIELATPAHFISSASIITTSWMRKMRRRLGIHPLRLEVRY